MQEVLLVEPQKSDRLLLADFYLVNSSYPAIGFLYITDILNLA